MAAIIDSLWSFNSKTETSEKIIFFIIIHELRYFDLVNKQDQMSMRLLKIFIYLLKLK